MKDERFEKIVKNVVSRLKILLGWEIAGTVEYRNYGGIWTHVFARIVCKRGKKRTDRKIFKFLAGYINVNDGKRYNTFSQYYADENDFYTDVILDIFDYFHLTEDIEIIGTNFEHYEYFIQKIGVGEYISLLPETSYIVCCRPPVVGFTKRFIWKPWAATKEEAINFIKKRIIESHDEGKPELLVHHFSTINFLNHYMPEEIIKECKFVFNKCPYGYRKDTCEVCSEWIRCDTLRERRKREKKIIDFLYKERKYLLKF